MATNDASLYKGITISSPENNKPVVSKQYRGISTVANPKSFKIYDINCIKQDIINHAVTNNLMDPKSTSHKIYCNKSNKWEPIMLLSSLFKIEVKTYQDNQL